MSKPKLFVIGARAVPNFQGGIEKQVEVVYPLLCREYDIDVAVMRKYQKNKKWKHCNVIPFPSFPSKKVEKVVYSFFASLYALFKKYDLVHVQGIGSALFLPLIRLNRHTKIVLHYRSQDYIYPKWGKIGRRILKLAEKIGVKYADVVIVVAKRYKDYLQKEYKNARIIYVPNVLIKSNQQDRSILSKLKLKNKGYVLSVGRITPEKRFEWLISSYMQSELPKKGIKLVIAGGEDQVAYFKKLKDMSKPLKDLIIFTGSVPRKQLNALYSNAYMFVLPSSHEGTPNVVLEAMSFGIPVYVSDIPAHKELSFPSNMYFKDEMELTRILNAPPVVLYNTKMLNLYKPEEVVEKISEIFKKLLEED